ncbi:growth/differentiation factor 9 [Megalops cyprinoides]|uniref:growth/differentiation factor 9 n=1 Tax=Megalops cyprinoides TaxID=118141 RepID=UPI001863D3D3|nr:growth/differentiation factor 9 [Megalops cyprinoides]
METLAKIYIMLFYFSGNVMPKMLGGFTHTLPQDTTSGPLETADPIVHGSILSSLLKALSEHDSWGDFHKLKPESKYVQYMKRLYRVSSKQKRGLDGTASHLYNTVRLITPRDECLEQNKEFSMQDLSYNLDRVRVQEQLLKSVLLYSFDKDQVTPSASVCYLDVREQEHAKQQLCPSSHHSVSFHVQRERSRRRKWVEVDITDFLRPLVKSQKKNINLLINLTCVGDGIPDRGSLDRRGPVELTLRSPSLLLYLNDTSELAYQRWPTVARSEGSMPSLLTGSYESHAEHELQKRTARTNRRRRNLPKNEVAQPHAPASPVDHSLRFEFPTDDCDLYDFRVSFSQLKLDHWIIAPHKYNPRYCKGICPRAVGFIYGSPVHTMVQNIIYEKLDSSVPRPSCVPSEYNPLSVLTIENDGSIAYKEYEEMIATKCTCR